MDILGWVTNNVFGLVTTSALALVGSYLTFFVLKKSIENFKKPISEAIVGAMNSLGLLNSPENRALAREVVHWVEINCAKLSGPEKKKRAVEVIQRLLPILSDAHADDLVEYAVEQMNEVLDLVMQKI